MEIKSLIERIEKSEGADRELDGAIAISLGWTLQKMKGDARPYYRKPGVTQYYNRAEPPAYTASIDAAMTLIPEGYIWMLTNSGIDHPTEPDFTKATAVVGNWQDTAMPETQAATPMLALCAAALKARSPSQ